MGRRPSLAAASSRAATSRGLFAALVAVAVMAGSGCALLIPPSWRGHSPVPLAGPIDSEALAGPAREGDELHSLSDAALRERIAADRQRLVELASAPGQGPFAEAQATSQTEAELRTIADRLPRLQLELERRGSSGELRTRHPVIR